MENISNELPRTMIAKLPEWWGSPHEFADGCKISVLMRKIVF